MVFHGSLPLPLRKSDETAEAASLPLGSYPVLPREKDLALQSDRPLPLSLFSLLQATILALNDLHGWLVLLWDNR